MSMNPFHPGYGQMPPVLAGRETEQDALREVLDELCNGTNTPNGVLLSGPRGMGKTVLLDWFLGEAKASAKLINTSAARITNMASLASKVDESLESQVRASSANVSGKILGTGGSVGQSRGEAIIQNYEDAIYDKISADHPGGRAANKRSPLVIAVDEAHTLQPDVAVALLNIHQDLARERVPVCLILVGTPDLLDHLRNAGKPSHDVSAGHSSSASFVERGNRMSLLALDDAASRQALLEPLLSDGCTVDEAALQQLLAAAQNYPYFIQVAGKAVWNGAQHNARHVDNAVVEQAMVVLEDQMSAIYQDRFGELDTALLPHATRKECLAAAYEVARVWLEEGSQPLSMAQMRQCLHSSGLPEEAHEQMEQRFKHTGFMVIPKRSVEGMSVWTLGIPSLASYIESQAEDMLPKPSSTLSMGN